MATKASGDTASLIQGMGADGVPVSTHAPGPWSAATGFAEATPSGQPSINDADGRSIAIIRRRRESDLPEVLANARMIAATLDLRRELESLLSVCRQLTFTRKTAAGSELPTRMAAAAAALAKADGRHKRGDPA